MVISCPSCSAKYQLADSKIKEKGTKVRCPRCSHTFVVFPQMDENDLSDRTELFIPREEALKAPKQPAPPPAKEQPQVSAPKVESPRHAAESDMEFDDGVFDQKTMVSKRVASTTEERSPADPGTQPKFNTIFQEKSAEKPKPKTPQDPAFVQKEDFEIEESESASEIKAFGDATLFEIQREGKKKKSFFKKAPKSAIAALIVLVIGYFAWSNLPKFLQVIQNMKDSSAELETKSQVPDVEMIRSSGWYRDDPSIYQDTLAQIAGLPKAEQEKPENRALLSETLILNGMLVGAPDQVNRGLSYIPLLTLSYPQSEIAMYGTAAYAVGNEDRMTMSELISRWPENKRDVLEYRLLEVVYLSKSGKLNEALQKSKSLFDDKPNFQRANNHAYLLILKHKNQAEKVFSENDIKKLSNLYERHHEILDRQITNLTGIYKEIDSLIGKSTSPKKESAEPEQTELVQKKTAPPNPIKSKNIEKKPSPTAVVEKKQPTKLPKPNKELIALNDSAKKDRKEAQELFKKGNQLFDKGNSDEALNTFREVLRLDSEFADVYKRMGMIYMSKKDTERALRSFKIYLQLKPETQDKKLVEGWIKSLQ